MYLNLKKKLMWIIRLSSGLLHGIIWIKTDVSVLPNGPVFKGQSVQEEAWPLKMGLTGSS
jgi:hypothetical protein